MNSILVIGGGPAGLRAAEVACAMGADVILCDAQPSVGRKFLIAGRGGLNLTHSEPVENFPQRYGTELERWSDLLSGFGPADVQKWAAELGVETYAGTSGRIFPRGQKAAGLLRAWVRCLRDNGVEFRLGSRCVGLTGEDNGWRATFENAEGNFSELARAVIVALGGASYPDTGSDGTWPAILATHGIEIDSWQPANCGWEVAWPEKLLTRAEGLPLKNLTVRAGNDSVSGELLITRYGLEGGAIYRLGRTLRSMKAPQLEIDFKPQLSPKNLSDRISNISCPENWFRAWKLSKGAVAVLEEMAPNDMTSSDFAIARVKNFVVPLLRPRPIAEAISSAGGVKWSELDGSLMLRKMPGVFVAGEMIVWEAPTGGYLLQGCFSTGNRAGLAATRYVFKNTNESAR